MAKAKDALEQLSRDPRVVSLARERELAEITHRIYMGGARREGREEGEARGIVVGQIIAFCEVYAIALTEERHAQLQAMSIEQLRQRLSSVKSSKTWQSP